MEMALYLVSLAILSTFLILTLVEKIRVAFNKKKKHFDQSRPAVPMFARK